MSSPAQQRRIKIFADTADKASLLEAAKNPLVSGMTTNPTLMRKAGVTDYRGFAKEIVATIKDKPISFEVFADDFSEMERQASEIKGWASNIYVKIPVTNSEGRSSLELVKKLSHTGVKLNVTALMTVQQVLDVCAALKGGAPAIVSVFAGRVADTGRDPEPIMSASAAICEATGPDCELLWASSRELLNVMQAEKTGCKIITVTNEILKKLGSGVGKDLTQLSLETVRMFRTDAEAAGFSL